MMLIEIVCIAGQAARGTTSHFNNSTALNAAIFSVMGIGDHHQHRRRRRHARAGSAATRPPTAPATCWGVRLGLALFVVGSLLGFVIVGNRATACRVPTAAPACRS